MRCRSLHACLLWATDLLMQDWPDVAVGGSHCSRSTVLNRSMSLSVTSQRLATAAGQPAVHTWHWASGKTHCWQSCWQGSRCKLLKWQIQPAVVPANNSTTAHEQQQGVMLTCQQVS